MRLSALKKENKPPITDIKGVISDPIEEDEFTIDSITYKMIRDNYGNEDINKGSGGKFIFLYYTTDIFAGQPIKDLIFTSYPKQINITKEVVQNAKKSLRSGDLDINAFRGGSFNYIFVIR